jgi:hypothetical protein
MDQLIIMPIVVDSSSGLVQEDYDRLIATIPENLVGAFAHIVGPELSANIPYHIDTTNLKSKKKALYLGFYLLSGWPENDEDKFRIDPATGDTYAEFYLATAMFLHDISEGSFTDIRKVAERNFNEKAKGAFYE